MGRRVEMTVSKFQFAMAQAFAFGETNPLFIVEGAKVQTGAGHSSSRKENNLRYLRGNEAAHFGIGTITQQGDAVSVRAARKLILLSNQFGSLATDPRITRAGGDLVSLGLARDAATFYAPAMVNRSEGILEVRMQQLLLGLLPAYIPQDPDELKAMMDWKSAQIIDLLSGKKGGIDPIDNRLRAIRDGATEFLQDPLDPDPGNRLFGLKESDFLDQRRDEITDPNSDFHGRNDSTRNDIPRRTEDLVSNAVDVKDAIAEAAKQT
jgi:hypothetical protein